MADHDVRDAADGLKRQARVPMGTHHNQITVMLRGHATDFRAWGPPSNEHLYGDQGRTCHGL